LKAGWGDAVCQSLLELSQLALKKQKFKFRKPIIPEDEDGEDGDGEEDDMEGNADLADNIPD
jgi:hypothetical protein